jgi:hypothetical protein
MKRVSSEAECWAHNPKVGGSKPPPAKYFFNMTDKYFNMTDKYFNMTDKYFI